MLLARTGIRRAEAAGLTLSDLVTEQGHNIAIVRHDKGDQRRTVKVLVDVLRAIIDYLAATGHTAEIPDAPLFVRIRRGDRVMTARMSGEAIEDVVTSYAKKAK